MRSASTSIGRAGAAFRQKRPLACSQALRIGRVGHLELAQDGVARRELDCPEERVRPRRDDDLVLAGRVDEDERDTGGGVGASRIDLEPGLTGQSVVRERVPADAANEADLGTEPGGRNRLIGALPARNPLERRVRDRLARPGQPLDPGHEVEVDATDDGDRGSHSATVCS